MKRNTLSTLVAIAALSLTSLHAGEYSYAKCKAVCEDPVGYIFGYGGVAFGYDVDATQAAQNFNFDFEEGFIVGGGLGVYSDLFCGSRFEIEGLYTESDLDQTNLAGIIGGDSEIAAVMVNALKEVPLGCITGYIGGGIGYAWTDISANNASDSDEAFAYQFIVGGDIPLYDCLSIFAQYKLLGISDTDYVLGGVATGVDDFFIHSVSIGARYSF